MGRLQTPTVLFVHGSWCHPSHFARVREILERAGYSTSCPLLPSIRAQPPTGLEQDAKCIRDELQRLVEDEHRDVIVAGHSYGGVVMTQAVDEGLAKKKREASGQKGGVVHLLYMCAFILLHRESIAGLIGGQLPPWIVKDDDETCHPAHPEEFFFHDLDFDSQKAAIGQLGTQPFVCQTTEITHLAYLHHPATYLYCTEDRALPLKFQQMMVEKASKQHALEIGSESCDAAHFPFLSMPKKVLAVLQKILERCEPDA